MDLNSINFWETLKKKVDEAVTIKKRGYDQILGDLKKTLRSNFPDTPIYAFGSRIMGIADADSDLDIYVHLDGNETYTENPTSKVSQNQVKIINSIKMDSGNWKFLDSHGGVCPIVIVRHIDSDIQCDISFSKKITVDQNNLINYIVDLQPIARYMVIYLRGWAQINGLTKFRGYIFNLMVIFFLQIRGKLPSIKDLQADLSPNFGPWKTEFVKLDLSSFNMKPVALNESEVRNILKDFFSYYSEFNYAQLIVCPWLGREINRTMIKAHMPSGSQRFHDLVVIYNRALVIQEIVHLNQNKAYGITQSELSNFKVKCSQMKMS